MSGTITESIRILLSGVVDYAGLFPPAGLSMAEAVVNYATYRNSNYNWMLGRFICPVGRLDEFLDNAQDAFLGEPENPWRLSVLANGDVQDTVGRVLEFNSGDSHGAVVDTLELKASSEDEIEAALKMVPEGFTNYFELPADENPAELVSALAVNKQRAKIRTGGVTNDLFPQTREIIRFVRTCIAANTPFKATAGLHHPIRSFRPLTYEANSPRGTMPGFLNLAMATGFAREGYRPEILEEIMEEEFEEVFEFDSNGAFWQREHFLNNYQLEALRAKGINSFGSCSFDEPIADLQEIGLL